MPLVSYPRLAWEKQQLGIDTHLVSSLRKRRWFLPNPNTTGKKSNISAVYKSACHGKERTILQAQTFPNCGCCDQRTDWVYILDHQIESESVRCGASKIVSTADSNPLKVAVLKLCQNAKSSIQMCFERKQVPELM